VRAGLVTNHGTVGRVRVSAVGREPGNLILDGLRTLVGPLHDDLKALGVVKERAVEFGLDGAGGRGTGKIWQADFL
jgi:hypothetical protein